MSVWVRHQSPLHRANWLWNRLRPVYNRAIGKFWHNGLERVVNGSDRVLICPELRSVSEQYEPDVWREVMAELRPGDTFVDVGAFIGLYTVAAASRLRNYGRIVAFEPDRRNF